MKNASVKNWCLFQGYKRNSLFPLNNGSKCEQGLSFSGDGSRGREEPSCLASSLGNTREEKEREE